MTYSALHRVLASGLMRDLKRAEAVDLPQRGRGRRPVAGSTCWDVLIQLAGHADDATGRAFPSISRLADITATSRNTVADALHTLAALGHIEPVGVRGRGVTEWRIPSALPEHVAIPTQAPAPVGEQVTSPAPAPAPAPVGEQVKHSPAPAPAPVPAPVREHYQELELNNHQSAPQTDATDAVAQAADDDEDVSHDIDRLAHQATLETAGLEPMPATQAMLLEYRRLSRWTPAQIAAEVGEHRFDLAHNPRGLLTAVLRGLPDRPVAQGNPPRATSSRAEADARLARHERERAQHEIDMQESQRVALRRIAEREAAAQREATTLQQVAA